MQNYEYKYKRNYRKRFILNIFNNDDLVRFSTRKYMTVIDDQVWVNEIDSWVSTKEYEEYVEYNKLNTNSIG